MSRRRAPLFARLVATSLVLAVGWLTVGTAVHAATVEHVRCAEHGELTHASAPAPKNDTTAPTHEHDHCSLLKALFDRHAVVETGTSAIALQRVATPPLSPVVRVRTSSPLSHAPKTSPPARV